MSRSEDGLIFSFEQGLSICKAIAPIMDQADNFSDRLQLKGFSAYQIYRDHLASYCQTEEEWEIHRRCEIEEAKEHLCGACRHFPALSGHPAYLYRRPYLEQLRTKRDSENGVPVEELGQRYTDEREHYVRLSYDPCERNRKYEQYYNRKLFEGKWNAMEARQWAQYGREVAAQKTELGDDWEVSRLGRTSFAITVAEECGRPLGFEFNKSMSLKYWPVLWKPLTEFWGLRWHFKSDAKWEFSPFVTRDNKMAQPNITPQLTLCPVHLRGNIETKAKRGEDLEIRFVRILHGFPNTYRYFYDHHELETNIKANFAMLSIALYEIENRICNFIN